MPLHKELERLKALDDPKVRGYQFEPFVGSLFAAAHFEVTPSPGAGGSRQVDLIATRGDDAYLIEAKWWSRRVGVAEVQALEDRLKRTPASVIGVLVSYSGCTQGAIDRVEGKPKRSVLLVTGEELERSISWDGDFLRMLRQKRDSMLVHSKTVFMSNRPRTARRRRGKLLPSTPEAIVLRDGTRSPWLKFGGDFGQFAFAREVVDIDWVSGSGLGVSLDVSTVSTDQDGLLALLHDLSDLGWLTEKSRWSIQQAADNWHGAGADNFAAVLSDWETRYEGVEDLHHTEEFCYLDVCDDFGFYTLTGQVAAREPRVVWRASLSFQLSGIPLDPSPLRHLCERLDTRSTLFFRPRSSESVQRHHVDRGDGVLLDVVGFIVEDNELEEGRDDREWAIGVVARNPFRRSAAGQDRIPGWWPDMVADSELIVCSLRSWHPLRKPKKTYRLWSCEEAWTSDALVFNPVADWDDDSDIAGYTSLIRPSRSPNNPAK